MLQRFSLKRTNFAEYDEEITELPTVFTYINPLSDEVKFKSDFNISYRRSGAAISVNLTEGENVVSEGPLKVDFKQRGKETVFKITPLNFKIGMDLDYTLTYTFEKSFDLELVSHIGVALRTDNNSYMHCDGKYYDGDVNDQRVKLGEQGYLLITPEKYTVKYLVKLHLFFTLLALTKPIKAGSGLS